MSERTLLPPTFDNVIPLPHRVAIFLHFGVFLWYSLVYTIYKRYHINCLALLNFSYSPHKYHVDGQDNQQVTGEMATLYSADPSENDVLLMGIRNTATKTFALTLSGLLAYWACLLLFSNSPVVDFAASSLPLIVLIGSLFVTFRKGYSFGQDRLHTSLRRILQGKINSATMRTNDILLSDSLTSYSKVINDLVSFLWLMFVPVGHTYSPNLEAFVLSYPALVRVKQCWYEFRSTGQRQHFFNLCKYVFLLGPVLINLLIKTAMKSQPEEGISQDLNRLNRWWYILSAISSTYLFIWDIKMDWGFEVFDGLTSLSNGDIIILRAPNKLVYKAYLAYYSAVLFDFLIRFIWVWKIFVIKETEIELRLQNHVGNFLFGYDYLSFGYAILELLEIIRRWVWCFIKLESDLVKLQLKDDFARAMPLANLKFN